MTEMKVVIFYLNDEICGVDIKEVQEIVNYQEISKVPDMSKNIRGIINLRGNVIPIFDLNQKFELGETKISENSKIIVLKYNTKLSGFLVDKIEEIINFTGSSIEEAPTVLNKNNKKYIKAIGKSGEKLVSILDCNSILKEFSLEQDLSD